MQLLQQYLAVGAAGALGAMLRLLVATVSARLFGSGFPIGTFIINISGSLFLGWFLTIISSRVTVSPTVSMAVAVGFVGSYTTFSTFTYESNVLLENGAAIKALVNVVGSIVAGLVAVRCGIWLAR